MNELDVARHNLKMALCERDYDRLEEYHPNILASIEEVVNAGGTPAKVRSWAFSVLGHFDLEFIQKCENAATWYRKQREMFD